jgi:hypothetical protein
MPDRAIDVALGQLTRTGRVRIRVITRDHRATETRLRNRAAWISKPHARIRVARVKDGDGYLEVDLLLEETGSRNGPADEGEMEEGLLISDLGEFMVL